MSDSKPLARPVTRRTVLSGVVGGLTAAAAATLPELDAASAQDAVRPICMAMHIHGPFSEGAGSFEAHLDQARRAKVDVVWFTDHDFRVAAADHRQAVHFDGASEPENTLAWNWARRDSGSLVAPALEFVDNPHTADDPGKALRLAATGGANGGRLGYVATAWNFTYNAAIGDTTLELDVLPESLGPDAVFVLQFELSHHPARGGRPAGIYTVEYRIGGVDARRVHAQGIAGTIELPAAAGRWNRLSLALPDDVAALWPDLVAGDNALRKLRIGLAVGAGTSGSVVVDRLVFHRTRRQGQAGEDMRAEVLAAYRTEYSDVTVHRAYEVSLVRHLNWFGGDHTLPAFPSPPLRDNDPTKTAAMVDFLHSHGGIVCWNHPLDVETPATLSKLMIERQNLGADLMEIGRTPQDELVQVFDIAARNAVFFTAVGASDDHEGQTWLELEQRNFTYAWAKSTSVADLVAALKAGSAWFVDPAHYRGALDIRCHGASVMGCVAVTKAKSVALELVATELPSDAALEVVTGVVDLAGTADLTPKTTVTKVPANALTAGRYALAADPGTGLFVRTQVRAADGSVIAVSNPLWLLRKAPAAGVPRHRRVTI